MKLSTRNLFITFLLVLLNGWLYLIFTLIFRPDVFHTSSFRGVNTNSLYSSYYKLSARERTLLAGNNLFSYTSSIKEYLDHHRLNYDGDNYSNHHYENYADDEMSFSTLGALFNSWPVSATHSSYWQQSVAHPLNHRDHYQTNKTGLSVSASSSYVDSNSIKSKKVVSPHNPYAIPRFDYQIQQQRQIAKSYRQQERPFIVYNVPDMIQVTDSAFELSTLLHHFAYTYNKKNHNHIIAEKSKTNYFMYYNNNPKKIFNAQFNYPDWHPPQTEESMTFIDFLKRVMHTEEKLSDHIHHYTRDVDVADQSLLYFTISATEGWHTPWIRQAFPFFTDATTTATTDTTESSSSSKNFFVVEPAEFKGINCRFGMKGVISAAHYDVGRNFIAMVRGRKRYVLLAPSQCARLSLLPHDHPSSRHTSIDWTNTAKLLSAHSDLLSTAATEAIVSRGDVLYLPSYWFHFIVSQDATIQCNARSGDSQVGREEYIRHCPSSASNKGATVASASVDVD